MAPAAPLRPQCVAGLWRNGHDPAGHAVRIRWRRRYPGPLRGGHGRADLCRCDEHRPEHQPHRRSLHSGQWHRGAKAPVAAEDRLGRVHLFDCHDRAGYRLRPARRAYPCREARRQVSDQRLEDLYQQRSEQRYGDRDRQDRPGSQGLARHLVVHRRHQHPGLPARQVPGQDRPARPGHLGNVLPGLRSAGRLPARRRRRPGFRPVDAAVAL
ncbi:hypothetical protein D3C81_1188900 [compost metagenome]